MSSIRNPQSAIRNQPELFLRERFRELNAASSRDAAALAARGQRASVWKLVLTPAFTFASAYLWHGNWRHGTTGLIAALLAAYEVFVRYAKLWELQHVPTPPPKP